MMINIPIICIILAVLACVYASYSDLKKGVIQNKLTLPLIAIGIILNSVYALMIGSILDIVLTVVFTAVIFIFGYLFWKLGAWAGGDVKLFTALAALIPFYAIPSYQSIVSYQLFGQQFPIVATYPFPFTIIINSILSMLPFLLIFVFFIVVKNKPHLLNELISPVKNVKKNIVLTLVVTSAATIAVSLTFQLHLQIIIVSLILTYLIIIILSKIPNRIKAVILSIVVVFALYKNFEITVSGIIIIFISIMVFELIKNLLTKVSKEALQDNYKISELKEGMIAVYNIYEKDDKVYADNSSFFNNVKLAINTGDISVLNPPKGKLLVGSMAAGLTKDDINLLNELKTEGKIDDEFRIKKGIPFAPSILIGLLLALFIGDLAFIIEKILFGIIY